MTLPLRISTLAREDLLAIDNMVTVPTILLNDEMVLFANRAFRSALGYKPDDLIAIDEFDLIAGDRERYMDGIRQALEGEHILKQGRICLQRSGGPKIWFDYYGRRVRFYDSNYLMLNLVECTERVEREQAVDRRALLGERMVRYFSSLGEAETMQDVYRSALRLAVELIPSAEFGSVLVRDGEYFVPLLSTGYDEYTLSKFRLFADELFIVKSDGTDVDHTVKYDDLHSLREFYQVVRANGDVMTIRSLISAPVRYHGKLVTAFSVDSGCPAAFTEADVEVMETLRGSLELMIRLFGGHR